MARLFDDGSSEYLHIDQSGISDYPFTMACWVHSDDATIIQAAMSIADKDFTLYHALYLRGDVGGDPVHCYSYWNVEQYAETTSGFSANTWHHVCGVWAAIEDRRVYIDGGSKGTDAGSPNPHSGIDRMSIGRTADSSPTGYFSGRIAEPVIWNAALVDDEVTVLSKRFSPLFIRPQNLVAYWPLIRDEDQDRVGGYDLTAYNTPSIAAHPPIIYPAPPMTIFVPTGIVLPIFSSQGIHSPIFGGQVVR